MKRTIFVSLLACVLISALGAQTLDKPAATVRLIRTESIPLSKLQKTVSTLEAQTKQTLTADQRKSVLDSMVGNALVLQAAERDKVVVSDAEMKTVLANYELQYGMAAGLGRAMTDTELQNYWKNAGSSYADFQKLVRDQQTLIDYIKLKRKAMFDAIKPVSDSDVQDYYDAHKASFFYDDMVYIRHIFIDTHQLTKQDDKDRAGKRAADILKELKAGATFDALVIKYSEDTKSKYNTGNLGWLQRNDTNNLQIFGQGFFDAVFKLKKGDTSGVIQSNVGYHIVQVTDRFDAKLLTLDDKVPPVNDSTLRESIRKLILNKTQNDVLNSAMADLVTELKKTAEIKIFTENLSW